MPIVSVIISNRNDTVMLAVTVRSVLEELKDVRGGGEVVIVDNSDQEIWNYIQSGNLLQKHFMKSGAVRLIRQDYNCLFTAREEGIRQAKGKYVLCLDSHMLVGRRMIRDLVDFMNSRKDNKLLGFAHAPINRCNQHESVAKHDRNVAEDDLGPWGLKYDHIRKITWKGMPWICWREWFLNELGGYGALSEHRISWGGGDLHIGVKPWLLGYQNWAVPTSPGIHIGPFPQFPFKDHYKYRLYNNSGEQVSTFGFFLVSYVLGGEDGLERNYEKVIARFGWKVDVEEHKRLARQLGERERQWLLERQIMTYDEWLKLKPWEDHSDAVIVSAEESLHGVL